MYDILDVIKGKEKANIYLGKWLAGGSLRTNDWFEESNKVEILNRNTLKSPQLNDIYILYNFICPKVNKHNFFSSDVCKKFPDY